VTVKLPEADPMFPEGGFGAVNVYVDADDAVEVKAIGLPTITKVGVVEIEMLRLPVVPGVSVNVVELCP
jgi:hypothetical protein